MSSVTGELIRRMDGQFTSAPMSASSIAARRLERVRQRAPDAHPGFGQDTLHCVFLQMAASGHLLPIVPLIGAFAHAVGASPCLQLQAWMTLPRPLCRLRALFCECIAKQPSKTSLYFMLRRTGKQSCASSADGCLIFLPS